MFTGALLSTRTDYFVQLGPGDVVQTVGKTPKTKIASKLEISFISYVVSTFETH